MKNKIIGHFLSLIFRLLVCYNLPMSESPLTIGGQALIEGVMIRAPHRISIAVRNPSGAIIEKNEPFISLTQRVKIFGLPFIRGMVNLIEMMVLGMRALNFSAEHAIEETLEDKKEKPSEKEAIKETAKETKAKKTFACLAFGISILLSLALGIFLFKFIPLFLTENLRKVFPLLRDSAFFFNLVDGLLRIGIFFLYILLLSASKTFRRVFAYHGAEHKAVFVYEKRLPLDIEHVKKESPRHPRCGTSFIIIVLIISILLLGLVPRHPDFILNFLRRLSIIPLIAGVAYELLKFTAKYERFPLIRALTYPGILTQYITTKEPDEAQMEVAIRAVKNATISSSTSHSDQAVLPAP